jgi:hypothetical protein
MTTRNEDSKPFSCTRPLGFFNCGPETGSAGGDASSMVVVEDKGAWIIWFNQQAN